MPIPVTPVSVRLGEMDTRQGSKHNVLGTLIESVNLRQRYLGRYSKRPGYSRMDRTADSGTLATGQGLAATSDALVAHGSDIAWVRDTASTTWRNRGTVTRAHPTDSAGVGQAGTTGISHTGNYPQQVTIGTKVYCFAFGTDGAGTDAYAYRVFEKSTLVELKASTIVATGGTGVQRARAIATASHVWLFYQVSATSVTVAKFDPASVSTAPVVTTYMSHSAGTGDLFHWDVIVTSAGVLAFAMWWNAAMTPTGGVGSDTLWTSALNTSTGLAGTWTPLTTGITATGAGNLSGAMAFMQYAGANGSLYIAIQKASATGTITLGSISSTTLASWSTLASRSSSAFDSAINRSICGYTDSGTTIYVFVSDAADSSTTNTEASYETASLGFSAYAAGTLPAFDFTRGAWAASQPFKVGSAWYIVTGYDDLDNTQRAYHLRSIASNGNATTIVATAMYARGGKVFSRGTYAPLTTTAAITGNPTPVDVSGNHAYMLLQQTDGLELYSTRWVDWHFAETYGPLQPFLGSKHVLFPGGGRVSAADASMTELVPAAFPPSPSLAVSAGATTLTTGTYSVCHTYAWYDNFGNLYRSGAFQSASIAVTATNVLTSLIPPLRHTSLAAPKAWVETWVAIPGDPTFRLYSRTTNSPTGSGRLSIGIIADPAADAEELYTTGGVLSNFPAPPFRYAFEWRNRLFLGGTDFEGEVWFSKEYVTETGPEFAPPLKLQCKATVGRDYAGGEISTDYAAIFKQDAIFTISGEGPDDTGNGGYRPSLLGYKVGCTNPASVVTCPLGLMYQGTDGTIHLITPSLTGVEIGQGVETYRSVAVQAALHDAVQKRVLFWNASSKILVADYGSADALRAKGKPAPTVFWSVHESTDLGSGLGACLFADAVHWLQSDGYVRKEIQAQWYDGTSTQIKHKAKLAPVQVPDLGHEFNVSGVTFIGEYAGNHTVSLSVGATGGSAPTAKTLAVTAGPEVFFHRPADCARIAGVDLTIEEATSANLTEGFHIDGFDLELQISGKPARVGSAQIL